MGARILLLSKWNIVPKVTTKTFRVYAVFINISIYISKSWLLGWCLSLHQMRTARHMS